MSDAALGSPPAEDLASTYLNMRDARDALRAEMEQKLAAIEADMKLIESAMLDMLKSLGGEVNSISTPIGTIVRSVRTKIWTSDWDALYTLIRDKNVPQLLEKRIAQKNMASFLEDNPDIRPAGLNIDREYAVTVRRK